MTTRKPGESNLSFWQRQCAEEGQIGPDEEMRRRMDALNEKLAITHSRPVGASQGKERYEPPYERNR